VYYRAHYVVVPWQQKEKQLRGLINNCFIFSGRPETNRTCTRLLEPDFELQATPP